MGQVLHGSASPTEAVRRAIQHSRESLRALAKRYGVNPKTIAKWKARTSARQYELAASDIKAASTLESWLGARLRIRLRPERHRPSADKAQAPLDLRTHLPDFVEAYNFARRLKTLKGLTPYELICKAWTSQPQRFTISPLYQVPGLNI